MYTAYRPCSDDYLADAALMRHMRELALQAAPEGVARIGHGAHVRKALRDLHAALASTRAEDRSPSLQKAAEAAGFFEPAAFSPAAKGPKDLPAMQGEPRIQRIARDILLHSGLQPDNARIEAALRAFAEGRSLRMEELMRLPDALRAECLGLFSHACRQAIAIQKEKDAAARWVYGRGPLRENPVFFEQALRLLREADLPHRRDLLDDALARQEGGAQAVLRLAHEMQARVCLRLQNLPGAMRLADAIDPQELLPISDAARILCAAPCYSACDEESRALLRRCIGEISLHAKVPEAEVVRRAMEMSALAERDTLRAEPAWYWTSDEGRAVLLAQLGRADVRLKKRTPDPKGYR
ncbi:MAG: hypothetical protein IJC54_03975 [Clostridia bacterium]|nr:hypothetical protein [Clostridia bacterium]